MGGAPTIALLRLFGHATLNFSYVSLLKWLAHVSISSHIQPIFPLFYSSNVVWFCLSEGNLGISPYFIFVLPYSLFLRLNWCSLILSSKQTLWPDLPVVFSSQPMALQWSFWPTCTLWNSGTLFSGPSLLTSFGVFLLMSEKSLCFVLYCFFHVLSSLYYLTLAVIKHLSMTRGWKCAIILLIMNLMSQDLTSSFSASHSAQFG